MGIFRQFYYENYIDSKVGNTVMACRMHTHLYNEYVHIKNATTSNKYAAKVKRFPWPPMRMTTFTYLKKWGEESSCTIYMRQEPSFRNLEKVFYVSSKLEISFDDRNLWRLLNQS